MSSVIVLDAKKICRVCLRCELNMRVIFDSQQKPTIAQMLSDLTTHKIQHFDELPDLICRDCLDLVFSAYKLKQQFESSNKILIGLLDNKQTDISSKIAYIAKKNALEKSTQTEEPFISSCEYSDNKFFSPCTFEILEVQNKSPEIQKSDTENDQPDKSNISKLYTEESLSEEELLRLLNDDNIQYLTNEEDEDELPLSMLIEYSDTSQIIQDKNIEISEDSQSLVVIETILENKLRTTKPRRGSYKLKNKYPIETADGKNKADEHKESEKSSNFGKGNKKAKNRDKLFNCLKCKKHFSTKDSLQRHIEIHDKKRFVCKECGEEFSTKEQLIIHGKSEGHDKPLLCPECGLRCKSSDILTVHLRRHNGEKPFKCKFCGKGFPRMGDLKIHEKYHTGEKSHFCDICGKGFFRKYNLRIHLRVHTGEKPYKCSHCPQAFAQSNDLKAHIRRHTGERFRCEICNAAFLQGYQIRQHKLQEHGIHELPPTQRVQKFISIEDQERNA